MKEHSDMSVDHKDEPQVVRNDRKLYLVTNSGASQWLEEVQFQREQNLPQTSWKAVVDKDGQPVCKVLNGNPVQLINLVSADGSITMQARAEELDERLHQGWKLVKSEKVE